MFRVSSSISQDFPRYFESSKDFNIFSENFYFLITRVSRLPFRSIYRGISILHSMSFFNII